MFVQRVWYEWDAAELTLADGAMVAVKSTKGSAT